MGSVIVQAGHAAKITVDASDKIASYSVGAYTIDKVVGYPNVPSTIASVYAGSGANTSSAFSASTQVIVTAGLYDVLYNLGTAPVVYERANYQPVPGTLNATGTLTAALILGGIVTSTTGAAVAATLDTGATIDAALTIGIGDAFVWSVINTGGNTFTVTASTGHTIVGVAAVVTVTSARFLTKKTAADTFVTYRLS